MTQLAHLMRVNEETQLKGLVSLLERKMPSIRFSFNLNYFQFFSGVSSLIKHNREEGSVRFIVFSIHFLSATAYLLSFFFLPLLATYPSAGN